ncbi:MAG: FG-GAP repeat domain-containing protein [Solirubrobacterales bacterium]
MRGRDRDCWTDLAVADYSSDAVNVLIGTGTGRFKAPKAFPAGESPAEVALGDFNHDGKDDVAVTNSGTGGRVAVLPRKAGVNFGSPVKYPVGSQPYGLAVGRLNGDKRPDVATANYTGTTSVLQGN